MPELDPEPSVYRVNAECGHSWVEHRPPMARPVDGELRACGHPDHYPNQYPAYYQRIDGEDVDKELAPIFGRFARLEDRTDYLVLHLLDGISANLMGGQRPTTDLDYGTPVEIVRGPNPMNMGAGQVGAVYQHIAGEHVRMLWWVNMAVRV